MKKKVLSFTAVVLAMAMTTTSVFAVTPKGTGDVDSEKGTGVVPFDTNDIVNIKDGVENGDYNGDGLVNDADKAVMMQVLLRPKYVQESYKMTIATSSIFKGGIPLFASDTFNGALTDDGRGFMYIAEGAKFDPDPTIEKAIDEVVNALSADTSTLEASLNNIWFPAGNGDKIELKNENGWAMFCYAVQDIIPVDADTEKELDIAKNYNIDEDNKVANVTDPAKLDRYNALKRVKDAIGIGKGKITVPKENVQAIAADLKLAFPSDIADTDISDAAVRVLDIVNKRFDLTITTENGKFNGTITAKKADGTNSDFVDAVISLKDYKNKHISDVSAVFGDYIKVTNVEKNSKNETFAEYTIKHMAENME